MIAPKLLPDYGHGMKWVFDDFDDAQLWARGCRKIIQINDVCNCTGTAATALLLHANPSPFQYQWSVHLYCDPVYYDYFDEIMIRLAA